jgi:hypothetical protein
MSWVTLDDNFPNHPKVLEVGPIAAWLWVCATAYCRRFHTGGFLTAAQAHTLSAAFPDGPELAPALVRVGLWESEPGGYRVHDYRVWYGEDTDEKAEKDYFLSTRRAAARKGGLARARNQASNPQANFQAKTEGKSQARSQAQPQAKPKETPASDPIPIPYPDPGPHPDPDPAAPDPVRTEEKSSAADRATTPAEAGTTTTTKRYRAPDAPTAGQLAQVAHDAIDRTPDGDYISRLDVAKQLCADRKFLYDTTAVADALDRAETVRKIRAAGGRRR